MALPLHKLGTTYPARTEPVDAGRALAYAAATNDANPAFAAGRCAPPVFAVVPTWPALWAAVADVVPADALPMIVHGEQDMHFHRALVPGRSLATEARPYSVRVGRSGTRYTVATTSVDAGDGELVLEQYVTVYIRGMSDGDGGGPDKPDHTFPDSIRSASVASYMVHVDEDQTYRYAEASGDRMPIHTDQAFARSVGLPGIVVHGLCTMAMCARAVVALTAGSDPTRLARLAVRFSASVRPGADLVTTLYRARPAPAGCAYAFEATSAGETVITHGRAEIRG